MSLAEYFEQHEEQAFVAKALATAVGIILVRDFLSGFLWIFLLIFPLVFLFGIRMHAAATGQSAGDLLREHITFFPVMRSEGERRAEVKPWVTYGIILVNVLIYFGFEFSVPEQFISDNLIFLPEKPNLLNVPLSAFTSMFLHGSPGHLWGNMTFLWVVGSAVERRVGRQRFTWLYLLTGLIGGLSYLLVEFLFHGRAGHALGASGAIAGIMGVFAVRCYFKSMIFPIPLLGIFSLIIPLSLKIRLNSLVIMALFFLSDLSGGIDQIAGGGSMIAHWAHLGGMISGMLIAGRLKLGEAAVEERHLEIGITASEKACGFEGGERSLEIALKRNPENADAVLAMARLKTKFTAGEEGRGLYEKAIGLTAASRPGELVELFREFFRKYRSVPGDHLLVRKLADLLQQAGDAELCVECLEKLVNMPETPVQVREKYLYQLGTMLEYRGHFDAAQARFARFANEFPHSILADKAREKAGDALHDARPAPLSIDLGVTPSAARTAPAAVVPQAGLEPAGAAPACPACGAPMGQRPAKAGADAGKIFWVCSTFPACTQHFPAAAAVPAVEPAVPPAAEAPPRYRLVFDGEIELSSDPAEVRENIARLLKVDPARVERLFSGATAVLRKDLDRETAEKGAAAFRRTGGICRIEPMPAAVPEPPPAAAPPPRTLPSPRDEAPAVAPAAPSPQLTLATAAAAPQLSLAGGGPAVSRPSFTCPKCGAAQEKGALCVSCGVVFAKLAAAADRDHQAFRDQLPGGAANRGMSESDERNWAMWCHLSTLSGWLIPFGNFLGPLAIWLWKRKESEFVDYHGKVCLNFQLTLFLLLIGSTILAVFTGFMLFVVGPVYGFLGIYTLYAVISSAMKASRGEEAEIAISGAFLR